MADQNWFKSTGPSLPTGPAYPTAPGKAVGATPAPAAPAAAPQDQEPAIVADGRTAAAHAEPGSMEAFEQGKPTEDEIGEQLGALHKAFAQKGDTAACDQLHALAERARGHAQPPLSRGEMYGEAAGYRARLHMPPALGEAPARHKPKEEAAPAQAPAAVSPVGGHGHAHGTIAACLDDAQVGWQVRSDQQFNVAMDAAMNLCRTPADFKQVNDGLMKMQAAQGALALPGTPGGWTPPRFPAFQVESAEGAGIATKNGQQLDAYAHTKDAGPLPTYQQTAGGGTLPTYDKPRGGGTLPGYDNPKDHGVHPTYNDNV